MNANQNTFTSNENKGLLWEMMMSNNMFDGVGDENFQNVKMMFENVIMRIGQTTLDESAMTKDRLLSLNKTAILEIRTNLEIFKKRNNEETFNNEKAVVFDRNLESAKTDFMETIALKRPKEPEFTENIDTPIENMNELLERLEREREQLLPPSPSPNPNQDSEREIKPKSLVIEDIDLDLNPKQHVNPEQKKSSVRKLNSIDELFSQDIGIGMSQSAKQVSFREDITPLSSIPETMKLNPIKNITDEELIGERRINSEIKLSNILDILREIDRKQAEILRLLKM